MSEVKLNISDQEFKKFLLQSLATLNFLSDQKESALDQVLRSPHLSRQGVWCEFGVADGKSLRKLAAERGEASLWGFDVFTGLPEDWTPKFPKGRFKQDSIPLVEGAHIVSGLFSETLPYWSPRAPITLCHIDCDLYDSAFTALRKVLSRVQSGSILVFDEVWNVTDFEKNEMLAIYQTFELDGALAIHQLKWDWLYADRDSQSVAILIR